MQTFPHYYTVTVSGSSAGNVRVKSAGLPDLPTATPAEFDGPGDQWSPETLLVGAVASCYLLTFRGIAQVARLEWNEVRCDVEGVLDRVERVTRFTEVQLKVKLQVPPRSDVQKAQQLLEKAKQACLITNSLNARIVLKAEVYHSGLA
jgi:peroxiredoxin-like protein